LRALVFLAAAVVVFLFLHWLLRQPRKTILQFAAVAAGLGLILLAATGRLSWVAAVFGAALPFARRLLGLLAYVPVLQRLAAHLAGTRPAGGPSGGNRSSVASRFLRMWLDHDTGEMDGEILEGRWQGRQLGQLGLEELLELYDDYQVQDPDSAALLQSYLERVFGDTWQARAQARGGQAGPAPGGRSAMTREEAYGILGLAPGADREEIIEAHRRLMQKLHPDRGGSTYLAAQINRAKAVLLG
jgi:hypothetical protein